METNLRPFYLSKCFFQGLCRAGLAFIRVIAGDTGFTFFLFHQPVVLALTLGWTLRFGLVCGCIHGSAPYMITFLRMRIQPGCETTSPVIDGLIPYSVFWKAYYDCVRAMIQLPHTDRQYPTSDLSSLY